MSENIEKNSRQIPTQSAITSNKDYCDQLYAWLQLNSERVDYNSPQRRIAKKNAKYTIIEKSFAREDPITGEKVIVLGRRTIPKYMQLLKDKGLIKEEDGYYYLSVLEQGEAYLIEFNTLQKLTNTLKRNAINIYVYLLKRFFVNGNQPFVATMNQMKEYIGHSIATTSNNIVINDILEILERLDLLNYELMQDADRMYLKFNYVRNKLPEMKKK